MYRSHCYLVSILLLCTTLLVSGCSTLGGSDSAPMPQRQGAFTIDGIFFESLKGFGGSAEQVFSVAVIDFQDLTGSRIEGGASTAVATSGKLLTEFLLTSPSLESKFQVYSRSSLKELLTERTLAENFDRNRKNRLLAETPESLMAVMSQKIQPLFDLADIRPVDLLITGAVVGYDKNLTDDGMGAGLLGYNAKQKRSVDQLYVMVQLIETKTGRIRSVGTAAAEIGSTLRSGGYLGFLSQYQILELEGGLAVNDPATLALFDALRQALVEMFKNA